MSLYKNSLLIPCGDIGLLHLCLDFLPDAYVFEDYALTENFVQLYILSSLENENVAR